PTDEVDEHAFYANGGFMQIDLPVHQSARAQEVFDAVDSLFVYHEFIFVNVEHGNDAINADTAFLDTCEERVAVQVIETVHVELTRNQRMKELARIAVSKHLERHVKGAAELTIQLLHESVGDAFVMYAIEQRFFQAMRKGPVPHVVQQDCQ